LRAIALPLFVLLRFDYEFSPSFMDKNLCDRIGHFDDVAHRELGDVKTVQDRSQLFDQPDALH